MKKETTLNEVMEFLQENMVTKQEFNETMKGFTTKQDFDEFRTEITGELRMIRNELEEIKKRLNILEKRTIEDADAAAKDVVELRRRVENLEKQIKQLQASR